jgi:hypothetical protein
VFRNQAGVIVPGYSLNGTLAYPSKNDVAQVVQALNSRAQAVLDGDRAAFLSTVDSSHRSFYGRQEKAWANTRQLPLASLSFAYDGVVEPDVPLRTATFLARVITTYRLAGYDTTPVQVEDGFSFVKRHGTWKLAGVGDADGQFTQGLPVPWEGSSIDTYGDGDYLAVVDRGRLSLARRIVALCHEGTATMRGCSAWRTPGRRWCWPPRMPGASRRSLAPTPRRSRTRSPALGALLPVGG